MNKSKTAQILVIAVSVLTVLGVVLGFTVLRSHKDFEKNITVGSDGETLETLAVSLTDFYPGRSEEYTVNLGSAADGDYEITLSFEKKGDGTLQDYIRAEIESDGEPVEQALLADYLAGKQAVFTCRLSVSSKTKLVIRYTMPEEVGNEAQKAVSDFDIAISVKKK